MSSTRYAHEDAELQQQRWASHPDFRTSISALLAGKRIAMITDRALQDLLWFIQWRSLEPRGLRRLAQEIIEKFPERLGTATMRRLRVRRGKNLSASAKEQLKHEFRHPNYPADADDAISQVAEAAEGLHEHLMRLCVDPEINIEDPSSLHPWQTERTPGVWYFDDLLGALKQLRSDYVPHVCAPADTETTRQITGALDFCRRRRRMILVEGKAGIGKTETAKAWGKQQNGLARYVEVPSSADGRSFFAAIAESIGVARGTSYNGQQIKLRVEEALRSSGLMLVLDEGQFLWPQYPRPQGIPDRIQWVKTAFDAGTPIAIVALPKFSDWQALYARRTLWDDDQLERRLNRKVLLPDTLSEEDLLKIAQARHPTGTKASWKLLIGYAMAAAKKQASAITEALESALDIAYRDGRDEITYDDIDEAVKLDFKPLEIAPPASRSKRLSNSRSTRVSTTDCHFSPPAVKRMQLNGHSRLARSQATCA